MNKPAGPAQGVGATTPGLRQVVSPAFATHIDVYAIENAASLNAELLAVIAEWRRTEKGVSASNQLGWHSSRSLFDRREPAFHQLFEHINAAVTVSARRAWKEFDPAVNVLVREGWVNVNGMGAFNSVHEHDAFHFSGVYYVAVVAGGVGRSGAIEFLNPAGISPIPLPNRGYIMPPKITMVPKAGSLMVFPSYLRHWVYPNQDEGDRVSIAFNIRLGMAPR